MISGYEVAGDRKLSNCHIFRVTLKQLPHPKPGFIDREREWERESLEARRQASTLGLFTKGGQGEVDSV